MAPRRVWIRQKGVFRSGVIHSDTPKNARSVEVDFGSEGQVSIPISQVFDRSVRTETPDDCCALDILNEPSVLVNLQRRYAKDEVYTFTSTVLLAVNPYRIIPDLYNEKTRESYSKITSLQSRPPHPYALADMAYRNLRYSNQVIVISGESGAGKTETAKIVMECLADRSRTGKQMAFDLQNKIMRGANPVFESFGNATTVRNGNSSRFGKYNTLKFNPVGSLVGTEVHSFLLESSRVVHFSECERTYHVFYELLAGATKEMLNSVWLDATKEYRLLHKKKMPPAREDRTNFKSLVAGLSLVGFSDDRQRQIFRTLAGLIHLGEVSFAPGGDDGCEVLDMHPLRLGSTLLGFDVDVMDQTLCERNVSVKQGELVTIYKVKRTAREAQETLESLMKKIYERTFAFIVNSMNKNMGGGSVDSIRHIGILDIYGFEQLRINSFEQMCINLANERLQSFFVVNVLLAEQLLYKQEGLQWIPINVPHSDETTNALTEVMTLLDNYGIMPVSRQQLTPGALDEKFTDLVHRQIGGSCIMEPKRGRAVTVSLATNQAFVVKHYAGEVTYSTSGWIQKNNARLHYQMECILRDSTEPLMKDICDIEGCDRGSAPFTSVARKYLKDLQLLLDTLQGCTLRYIRCFKPNNKQIPHCFDPPVVCEQLVQSGTIELVKIMHMGYPHRCGFAEIKEKFLKRLPLDLQQQDARMLLGALMHVLGLKASEWAVGLTRVFLKNGLLAVLDQLIGASGQEAEATANKLRKHLRRVKFTRCINVVRICLWLPGFIKRQRLIQVRNGFVRCCQNLVRIQRWVRRARRRLRTSHVDITIAKFQSATRILLALHRWRYRCRRGKVLMNCAQACLRYQDRTARSEQRRFFDLYRTAVTVSKQRMTLFARHALLVGKLRLYVRRRLRIWKLLAPLVRFTLLKVVVRRYLVKVRARVVRHREQRERMALELEVEELRAQKFEGQENFQRLQQEFAVLQEERMAESIKAAKCRQERDAEVRKAAQLQRERDEGMRKAAEFQCAIDEEVRKAAGLQLEIDEESIKLAEAQQERDEEARKAAKLLCKTEEEARTISKLQQERDEEARKAAKLQCKRDEETRTISKLQQERDEEARKAVVLEKLRRQDQKYRAEEIRKAEEKAKKAALAAQRLLEPPAIGPTFSAELARLRAENAILKGKIADNPDCADASHVKHLEEEVERLRAKNAQQVREQTFIGVQCLTEENARLRRREVGRLSEKNRILQEEHKENTDAWRVKLLANGEAAKGIAAKLRGVNQRFNTGCAPRPSPSRRRPRRDSLPVSTSRSTLQRARTSHSVMRNVNAPLPTDPIFHPHPRSVDSCVSSAVNSHCSSPHKVATPSRNLNSAEGTISPPWNPERSFLAHTPSLSAQHHTPGMESLEDACCRQNSPTRISGQSKMIMSFSPLSPMSSPSAAKFHRGLVFSRYNLEDETKSRLRQPVIRRNRC